LQTLTVRPEARRATAQLDLNWELITVFDRDWYATEGAAVASETIRGQLPKRLSHGSVQCVVVGLTR